MTGAAIMAQQNSGIHTRDKQEGNPLVISGAKTGTNQGWAVSYAKAAAALRNADLDAVCARCGAEKNGNSLRIRYYNTLYETGAQETGFTPPGLSQAERILILHYLTSGTGSAARKSTSSRAYLSFPDLPGGMFYDYAYRKNGPHRLMAAFGNKPSLLAEAALQLGGAKAAYGDVSVQIPVFPMLDVIVVLYTGDEEFPPDVNILFKNIITAFLQLEDIAVLAGCLAGCLQKAAAAIDAAGILPIKWFSPS